MLTNFDDIKDDLSKNIFIRSLFICYLSSKAMYHFLRNDYYKSLKACCRVKRLFPDVHEKSVVNRTYGQLFTKHILIDGRLRRFEQNPVILKFLKSEESEVIKRRFRMYDILHRVSLKYPRPNDPVERQGNCVIIKRCLHDKNEKGVIYLKFNESFKQFVSLFDLDKIAKDYRVVLEPSTWGYMEEDFHLFIGETLDVVVQAQDEVDYKIIDCMNVNLFPIRMGAGDWIDTDLCCDVESSGKVYDIIMNASWSRVKRHHVLFKSISEAKLNNIKIALVGYPWDSRTLIDIKKEAAEFGLLPQIDFFEKIPLKDVLDLFKKSKVAVMLTKREGANRALYEALLSGIPVILYKYNYGVNKDIINSHTGRLADDKELGYVIKDMVSNYSRYDRVAEWAKKNIGRNIAYDKLNDKLKVIASQRNEEYTVPIVPIKPGNNPYVNDKDRIEMIPEYENLKDYLRSEMRA